MRDAPLGIVTERDIIGRLEDLIQKGKNYDPPVASLMSSPLVTVNENATLFEALVVAKSREIRHLPVTNTTGKLVGVVTQTDLVAAHFRIIDRQSEALERAVADRTQELMEVNRRLRELSLEDPLLQIGNRRAMEVDLTHTHAACHRHQRAYAIILLDVDHFKLYNDHYGHPAGDDVLRKVGSFLKEAVRKGDRLYRYGGEELLPLLPETSREGAENLGQRVIRGLVELAIPHETHPLRVVTMSGGISGPEEAVSDEPWHDVVQRADCALYRAKKEGRNRVAAFYFSDLLDLSEGMQ